MLSSSKADIVITTFIKHLRLLGVSPNTLNNYRSDLSLFSNWAKAMLRLDGITAETLSELVPFLSPALANKFKSSLSSGIHSENTVNRRLSSLRALSRFLLESQILESDFMYEVTNLGTRQDSSFRAHPVVGHFQKHLESQKVSKNTVKNYISDVKHFLEWFETNQ